MAFATKNSAEYSNNVGSADHFFFSFHFSTRRS